MPMIKSGPQQPSAEFVAAYGEALLEWSYVENRLYFWFRALTGMSDRSARAVFFSARSFNARTDMTFAVIEAAEFKGSVAEIAKEFIGAATNKAGGYARLRNMIAHGQAIAFVDGQGAEVRLVQGKAVEDLHGGLSTETLKIAAGNFRELSSLIGDCLRFYQAERKQPLQVSLDKLLMLPNEADRSEPSRSQLGQQRQRQAARRKMARKARTV